MASSRRIGFAFVSQIYGVAITSFAQLALTPVLISAWGVQRFGEWMVAVSWGAAALFLDFGLVTVAKNRMVLAHEQQNADAFYSLFHTLFRLLVFPFGAIVLACLSGFALKLENAGYRELLWGFLLVAHSFSVHFIGLIGGAIRAVRSAAIETFVSSSIRFAEALALVFAALYINDLTVVAVIYLIARLACIAIAYLLLVSWDSAFRWTSARPRWTEIQEIARPALSCSLGSVAQLLLIHAPVAILGASKGPTAAGIYAACRTVSRSGMAVSNAVTFAFGPELTRLIGRSEYGAYCLLAVRQIALLTVIGLLYGTLLLVFDDQILRLFSAGAIASSPDFFWLLVLAVCFEQLWTALSTPMTAVNRFDAYSKTLFLAGTAAVLAAIFFVADRGAVGVGFAVMCAHALTAAVCAVASVKHVGTVRVLMGVR